MVGSRPQEQDKIPVSFANNPIATPILSAVAIKGCLAFALLCQTPPQSR